MLNTTTKKPDKAIEARKKDVKAQRQMIGKNKEGHEKNKTLDELRQRQQQQQQSPQTRRTEYSANPVLVLGGFRRETPAMTTVQVT